MLTYDDRNRRVSAVVLNYYNRSAVSNVPYPMDSVRRRYVYTDRSVTEQDSSWRIPCYPGMACIRSFSHVATTQRAFDERNNLLTINTSSRLPDYVHYFYPNGAAVFTYAYDGPDGLLSRRTNETAGLVYAFTYEKK